MAFPTGITYATIVGTLVQAVVDGSDGDTHPDSVECVGSITFTPAPQKLKAASVTPEQEIFPQPIVVNLEAGDGGTFTVELLATDCPALNPTGWTYTVSFDLIGVTVDPFSMAAPGGVTTNLADVMPLDNNTGTVIVPGPPGPTTALTIGTVTTLGTGVSATASVTGTAPNLVLNLGLPKGNSGTNGTSGDLLTIGTTTTLASGSSATATITGTSPNKVLNLGIPKGTDGAGTVIDVTAADSTITVGGTSAHPTVKVAPAGLPALNPTGAIIMYGGSTAPTGYVACDGTSYLRTAQAALFAVIGTSYGSVDGTHFNVPNMTSAFPYGATPGATGGAATHTHTVPSLTVADHTHPLSSNGQALIHVQTNAVGSSPGIVLKEATVSSWNPTTGKYDTNDNISTTSLATGVTKGAILAGTTDLTGVGSTGTGTSGSTSTLPPFIGVAFFIKL